MTGRARWLLAALLGCGAPEEEPDLSGIWQAGFEYPSEVGPGGCGTFTSTWALDPSGELAIHVADRPLPWAERPEECPPSYQEPSVFIQRGLWWPIVLGESRYLGMEIETTLEYRPDTSGSLWQAWLFTGTSERMVAPVTRGDEELLYIDGLGLHHRVDELPPDLELDLP